MLITELGKMNKFQVLESTALEHLKSEIKLGEDGFVGQDEKVEKRYLQGPISCFEEGTRFRGKSQGVNLGGFVPGNLGNLGIKQNQSDVRIDWRVVDVATRKSSKQAKRLPKKDWFQRRRRRGWSRGNYWLPKY